MNDRPVTTCQVIFGLPERVRLREPQNPINKGLPQEAKIGVLSRLW